MFLVQLATNAARPAVSYRAIDLGASGAELGAIVAAFAILSLVCAVPVGSWIDRWGEGPFLAAGVALVAVLSYALIRVDSLAMLGVALALLGLGHLLLTVGMQALVARRSSPDRTATHYGIFTVVVSLGQFAGPLLFGLLAGDGPPATPADGDLGAGTTTTFAAAGIAATVGFCLVPTVGASRPQSRPDGREAGGRSTFVGAGVRVLRIRNMPQAMLASLSVLAAADVLVAYLPVYGQAAGLSVRTVGLLLATRAAASMVSRAWMGALVQRFGVGRLLTACTAVSAAALGLFPLAGGVDPLLYLLMACAGLGIGLGQPLTLAWIAQTAPADIRATALGVRLSGNRAGQVVIPAAMGGLIGVLGVGAVFWAMAALLASSMVAVVRRRADFDPA